MLYICSMKNNPTISFPQTILWLFLMLLFFENLLLTGIKKHKLLFISILIKTYFRFFPVIFSVMPLLPLLLFPDIFLCYFRCFLHLKLG